MKRTRVRFTELTGWLLPLIRRFDSKRTKNQTPGMPPGAGREEVLASEK